MADSEQPTDNWVLVDDPEKPAAEESPAESAPAEPEQPAEPEPEPETEPQPEPEAEPEPQPEAEPEPQPEAEPESQPEAEPEPQPEAEPEPQPEPEPEPQSEPEPVEPEPKAEPEPEPVEDKPADPEPAPVESEPEKPVEPEPEAEPQPKVTEDKPAEPEQEPEPQSEPAEDKPAEDKPAEDKPAEDKPAEETEVTIEVEIGGGSEEKEVEVLPEPGDEIHYGSYIRLCQVGSDMTKVKKSKGFPRQYKLEKDLLSIVWDSKHKALSKAKIAVTNITEVRGGRSTDSFKISKDTHPEDVCFSIIYKDAGNNLKTLDLAALTVADRTAWVEGLKAILRQTSSSDKGDERSKVRERWLKDLFDRADKDNSGTLDLKEVLRLMNELNVGVSQKQLKKQFKAADTEGASEGDQLDGKLNFDEFCTLFKDLSARPELRMLFNKYSSKMEWLTVKDLQKFLQLEQGADNPSLEFCTQLVQKYEPTDEGKAQGFMSMDGFSQFMLGPENDIINVDRCSIIYQDMTQPLSHYYIASSHNTYLLEDQLKGPSSCEAYVRALRKGCRCVELDCWDGPDGEPIIYHGYTLTSKIPFNEVIEAVRDHAFVASTYPVILSIENHCSVPQQARMAEIMKEILGDTLYDDARDESRTILPSPEDLRRKILVKGKKLNKTVEEADDDEGEVTDEDEAEEIDQTHKVEPEDKPAEDKPAEDKPAEDKPAEDKPAEDKPAEDKPAEDKPAEDKPAEDKPAEDKPAEDKPAEDKPAEDKPAEDKPAEDKPAASGEDATDGAKGDATPRKQRSVSFRSRQRKTTVTQKPKKKIKLNSKLSKCVNYVQSVHFPGIEGYDGVSPAPGKCWQMSSFGESTATKLSKESAVRYVTYNKVQVSRTYPKGSRVDSSNYDPTPMWNAGCQIVALNYQTPGKAMDLNEGKFRDNGGCGYLLKPAIMREDLSRFDHNQRSVHFSGFTPKVITVKVISGQKLPKPGDKKGEIIDPYVVLQVVGAECDNQKFRSKTVNDNGFNPRWSDQSFQMQVRFPELAVLRVKVMDEDWGPNADDFIGSYTLPLNCLVPGYRHVHLTKSGLKMESGSLFLHIQIQDYVAPHRAFGKTKTTLKLKKSREYPEHHQVGHQGIDLHFRNIPAVLHRAVDMREDFTFYLLHFKELVGHGPQASLSDCVELLAARATSAGLSLCLQEQGESEETRVYQMSMVSGVVPASIQPMLDTFNQLNSSIQALIVHGQPTINELQVIHKEAKEQEDALRQHINDTPPKRPDLVLDQYARTMFTVSTEAERLTAAKEQAADTLKKLFGAATSAGIALKPTQ
ncbi:1-phosphatidylinositol 4,5-bisphosphate phosphodiesterase delta-1-like isoform X2 [Halichondria panicea]|uniref:1-phosphatidylinositol 4,5-bisphosphate phosphodiesterase delta-1-like isoform X2 n=1 Tax=Halichondria panicea TaxID=6063 RepID=UPI00312BC9D5